MKTCKHWKFFCWQVDGNLGLCRLTGEWCKGNRGWFPEKNKWLNCKEFFRFQVWLKYKFKRLLYYLWLQK